MSISVPASQEEVLRAVRDVVADGTIRGTKQYQSDEYISGAESAENTSVFPRWAGSGQVFYKLREKTLDPWGFKDSGDSGTLAVRYIVEHADDQHTNVRIDAIFVDDFHHRAHASDGSVESAEYGEIQDRVDKARLQKRQAAETEKQQQQELAAKDAERKRRQGRLEMLLAQPPGETLEQHVRRLRHEAERVVAANGAQLKSAPFHSASSLKTLPAGSQVVIVISTPYWYGVETEDGEHGWLHHSQVEELP